MNIHRSLVAGCIVAASLLTGCATDKQVISQATDFHGSLDKAVMHDQILAQYLQSVGDRIIDAARDAAERGDAPSAHKKGENSWMFSDKVQFHLVNSKTLNAFTTGGEHMYIYNELFQQCKTEDELAAVMAHEFAHIYGRHVQQGMDRRYTPLLIAAAGAGAGAALGGKDNWQEGAAVGGGLGLAAGSLGNMKFTRNDENEADKYGFKFYTRAGWDPAHFGDFFQSMIDKGYDKTPEIVSDHPSLSNRVKDAQRRTSELPPDAKSWRRAPVADASRFKELQQRAKSLGKNLPDDKSLSNQQELLQALPRSCVAPVDPKDVNDARIKIDKRIGESQKKR